MKLIGSKKCYLCPKEAKEYVAPGNTWNTFMECPECKQYEITHKAKKFAFNRDDGLNMDDELKLSIHVQNEFMKTGKPVIIDTDVLKEVTGKSFGHVL